MRRLGVAGLCLSLAAGPALAQSAPPTSPPPSSGPSNDRGGVEVDEAGLAIGALQWALKKKREADARKREEARREAERKAAEERAAAEGGASMQPIPDPVVEEPEAQPPARTPDPTPPPTARPYTPPKRAPQPVVTAQPTPAPEPVSPKPEPAPVEAVAPPAPAVIAPPPAPELLPPPPPPAPSPEPVDVGSPLWGPLGIGLALLLALAAVGIFVARRMMILAPPPLSVKAAVDMGLIEEPDFGGAKVPQLSVSVGRGEAESDIHYPQAAGSAQA